MRISANQPPEPPPLPRQLLDRIGPIALIAVIVLLAAAAGHFVLGALGVALVVLLAQARRRSDQLERARAERDGKRTIAKAGLSLLQSLEDTAPAPDDERG
jgi:hypothetical protein